MLHDLFKGSMSIIPTLPTVPHVFLGMKLDYFQDTHKDGCLAHGQLIFCKWQPIICCNLAINQHWQGLPWSLGTFKLNPLHKSFKISPKLGGKIL